MGDVDRRYAEVLLQFLQFRPHVDPELGIEIAERLVHQEHGRFADDGPAQSDSLSLAPAQLHRLSAQERLDLKKASGAIHPLIDLALGHPGILQRERDVPVHRHVRIEGIALKHHRDVPLLRIQVIHQTISDVDFSPVDVLEARDAAEGRRLATPRGS